MKEFFINNKIDNDPGIDLMAEVRKSLMTPDVVLAMQAGCHFEVSMVQDSKNITISLKSVEKVSILKFEDGRPISIIVKR